MNDLEALQEIRRDAEQDVHDFEGAPFTGRTIAEYIGKTRALICALSSILERVYTAQHLVVGPDETLVVAFPDTLPFDDVEQMNAVLVSRLGDRVLLIGGDGVQLSKVQPEAPPERPPMPADFVERMTHPVTGAVLTTDEQFAAADRAKVELARAKVELARAYDPADPAFDDHDMEGCQDPDCTETHYP